MTATAASSAITLALAWLAAGILLCRFFPGKGRLVLAAGGGGFAGGWGAALLLVARLPAETLFAGARTVLALLFIILWAAAVQLLYRSAGVSFALPLAPRLLGDNARTGAAALAAGLAGGLLCTLGLPAREFPEALAPAVAGPLLLLAALFLEPHLSGRVRVTGHGLLLGLASLALLAAAQAPRLDLFAPLSMKLMKFAHDFVHQFMESMLIPDHFFFTDRAWGWIGFLFGDDVGFWGGLIVWFFPALLVVLGTVRQPLPSVAHIRQGAARRGLLAGFLRERRERLIVPLLAAGVLALAVWRSLNPAIAYWDPKPLPVSVGPAGEIAIPPKGEGYDLDDGKLHKFVYREGGREVRFFVVRKPDAKAAVALDACAICQPEGYGQGEGAVICHYCKTLIPIETVGEPGGCNPVPVRFTEAGDGVRIAAGELVSTWENTVQSVQGGANVPGRR